MKRILRSSLFTLIIFIFSLSSLSAQWEGWNYRRAITINNTSGSTLTDYQIKITLNSTTFETSFNNTNVDGSDLRITKSDGVTQLPFWIENWDKTGQNGTLWVKVDNIATGSSTQIYLYYGNPSASNTSNGLATFEFFDDFETWNYNSGWSGLDSLPEGIADQTVAVYHDSVFYSIGGYGVNDSTYLNKNYEYNLAANTWIEKTPMPTKRWGMVAVEFNDKIYVFGGVDSVTDCFKNEVYDPATDSWDTTKSDIPYYLAGQGIMGVKYGDKIHLFYYGTHYEYDPETDIYTQKADAPYETRWGTCALVNNKIYVIGGYKYGGGFTTNYNEEYDPSSDSWTLKTPLPIYNPPFPGLYGTTRENPVINGKIYVAFGKDGSEFYTTNYVYDPLKDEWQEKGHGMSPRDGVGCAVVNNKLYVVGGRNNLDSPFGLKYLEVYDPNNDTYVPNSGKELWRLNTPTYLTTVNGAASSGDYVLAINSYTYDDNPSISTQQDFTDPFALDFDWKLLAGDDLTEYSVSPNDFTNNNALVFYKYNGSPYIAWRSGGVYVPKNPSQWNIWHYVSIHWAPPASTSCIFDGLPYTSLPSVAGTNLITFMSEYGLGTQYIDNVRVRKWTGTDPSVTVGGETANPLPVELSLFTAKVEDSSVMLKWRTETEVKNYGFEILKQTKKEPWVKIGFVQGHGNSNIPNDYSYTDKDVNSGKYNYRLKQIDTDGSFVYSAIIEADFSSPKTFKLSQNYPNPFNPTTRIVVDLPIKTNMRLEVFNTLGQLVKVLASGEYDAGSFEFDFNASGLASGLYFYRIQTPEFVNTKKMLLLR